MRGIFAAAVTPFESGDKINEAALQRHVDALVRAGVDGICVGGSTGEFPRLEIAQRKRLLHVVLEAVQQRASVLAAVGHASLDGTLALVAGAFGCSAVLVPPPFYFRYAQPELLSFYRRVVAATDLPVYVYNIPQFTSEVSVETARALLSRGTCAGIKDSGGETPMLKALAEIRRNTSFTFFCGNDARLAEALAMGADGGVSGVAACVPELLVALYGAFRAGEPERVHRAHELLMQLIGRLRSFPTPVGVRLALETRGLAAGPHAVPLASETENLAREYRHWFESWLPGVLDFASHTPAPTDAYTR